MATHIPTNTVAEPALSLQMVRSTPTTTSDWKQGLPVLQGKGITLRELRVERCGLVCWRC